MGEMADWVREQGQSEWYLHLAGLCGEDAPCAYCERDGEPSKPKKTRKRTKKRV